MSGTRLRILHMLTHGKINAGGAIQAFLLARELKKRGHDVVMAFSERKGEPDLDTKQKVEHIGCGYVGLPLKSFLGSRALRQLLTTTPFDVVHLHREVALEQFLRVAHHVPDLGAIANVGTSKPPEPAQAKRLNDRRIDRVVVVAKALKDLLVAAADVEPTRIEPIEGAFDELAFDLHAEPLDRELDLHVPPHARLVGVIANLDPKKGHKVFVAAAARVAKQRDDVWFVCAGKGDVDALRAKADEVGLPQSRLLMLGFRRDVPRLLRTFDVSVSASTKGEGMTGGIRESLAMGCPVVCTALAGNVELVRSRETGLLVPVKDADALAAAILETLADPTTARARAALGQREVRSTLTSARRAERMEALYRDVVHWRRVRRTPIERILTPSSS